MIRPGPLARDLQLEPIREAGGWRLSWTWWQLENCRTVGEGWDMLDWPSTDAILYPTHEAAAAAITAHKQRGALPAMETPEYGPD